MSNLKYLNEDDLRRAKIATEKRVRRLGSEWSGQKTRLEWITFYLDAAVQRRVNSE